MDSSQEGYNKSMFSVFRFWTRLWIDVWYILAPCWEPKLEPKGFKKVSEIKTARMWWNLVGFGGISVDLGGRWQWRGSAGRVFGGSRWFFHLTPVHTRGVRRIHDACGDNRPSTFCDEHNTHDMGPCRRVHLWAVSLFSFLGRFLVSVS